MRRSLSLAAVVVLLGLVAASCGSGGTQERPASTARLSFTEPAPGARVPAGEVMVRLKLEGALLLTEMSKDVKPDTGHVHVKLDGKSLSLLAGLEFDLAVLNKGPLAPGQHLLEAEFVAADHGYFNPRVIITTTFIVE